MPTLPEPLPLQAYLEARGPYGLALGEPAVLSGSQAAQPLPASLEQDLHADLSVDERKDSLGRLEHAVLLSLVRSTRRFGADVSVETRLVCKQWDQDLRRAYWKRRWLNIRPTVASWGKVGERLRLLIEQAPLIHKVKLDNVLTDIVPASSVRAVQKCPELGRLAQCQIKEIKVGRLDMLNEVILKCMLSSQQGRLRHFAFRAKDAVLFLGRRSSLPNRTCTCPSCAKLRSILAPVRTDGLADDVHGTMAGLPSYLAGELAGRGRDAIEQNNGSQHLLHAGYPRSFQAVHQHSSLDSGEEPGHFGPTRSCKTVTSRCLYLSKALWQARHSPQSVT
ncbi:hypothetical protein L1887_59482 [Cichorium endivia]|nr:hypothetical protein L1887_59482 [Cichorium endivia]